MIIRDATEADLAAIRDIYNHALIHTTAIWNDDVVDLDNRRAWFQMRAAQGYPILVAEIDGAVVGYASFGDFRVQDGFRATVENSIYVTPEAQGRGVAKALMRVLIDRARGCGKHVMIAAVHDQNEGSLRLHRSLGFREAGVLRQAGQKFGAWVDLAFLELRLDDRPQPDSPSDP
jgi:L-amino acid N-acyltransferase